MAKVSRVSLSGGSQPDLIALSQQVNEILRVLDDRVEFGEPQDPSNPTSTTLAGDFSAAGGHNGTPSNILGSWVEVTLESTGTSKIACYHNLFLDSSTSPQYTVPVSGEPNCRWLFFGCGHDGTGGDATSGLIVCPTFVLGDTVAPDYIELRFSVSTVGTALTVDATHPVLACLFFTQASRGIAG